MTKLLQLLSLSVVMIGTVQAQNVNIPDTYFKAYLVGNPDINTNADNEIQTSEASAYTGYINCADIYYITDMTGIEAFTALTGLYCSNNQITALDVSNNTALITLDLRQNQVTSLDVSNNLALDTLNFSTNQIASINVSANTSLKYLNTGGNLLTSLDVSSNTLLTLLHCGGNQLTSLDVSNNTSLLYLTCWYNSLTSLDLSNNTVLSHLVCSSNPFTALDVSNNLALIELFCHDVPALTAMDLSGHTLLSRLVLGDNQLTSLNIANGNNSNFTLFNLSNNPNLYCIEVDDVAYSNANWTNIDNQAFFSTDCANCVVAIPDANFKAYLVGNQSINTNNDGEIQCSEASVFDGTIYASNLNIADLTGIESFTYLTNLYCSGNQLTNLDVSNSIFLSQLYCAANQLTDLDVSSNTFLTQLYCNDNQITDLDISSNTDLGLLWCYNNLIDTLQIGTTTILTSLYCYNNQLESLDISGATALTSLTCGSNQLTDIDVSANTALVYLECQSQSFGSLTSLNIKNGNNSNFVGQDFRYNTNLACIKVDDAAYAYTNFTNKDTSSIYSVDCLVGIESITTEQLHIYPNPATSVLYIDATENIITNTITDLQGRRIIIDNSGNNNLSISELPAGIYFLQVTTEKGIYRQKFVKE